MGGIGGSPKLAQQELEIMEVNTAGARAWLGEAISLLLVHQAYPHDCISACVPQGLLEHLEEIGADGLAIAVVTLLKDMVAAVGAITLPEMKAPFN
jgi:hypothetical protein